MDDDPNKDADGAKTEPAPTRPVRVALWGVGPHARRKILPAIAACPATILVGLTTRDRQVADAEAARYSCRAWSTPDEMLASRDVEVVYLATPIGLHGAQGKKVLAAGKHLWCEKSLTASTSATLELVELSRQARLCLCEAFMYLYHPQLERILEVAMRGELGQLSSIVCRFNLPFLESPGFRHSRELGGSALLDVGCYPISLARSLAGAEPKVVFQSIRSAPGLEVDVSGHAVLEFPSTTVAYLEWGYGRAYLNDVMLSGETGSLYADRVFSKADGWQACIELRDAGGRNRTETFSEANAFVCMLEVFARAVVDEDLQDRLRRDAALQAECLAAFALKR